MLESFVVEHRNEIIARCRGKVAKRSAPSASQGEIEHGVPIFLDELTAELRLGLSLNPDISTTAASHGHDMLVQGYTPAAVVHNYGDVCQSITELAMEKNAPISSDDFRMLNRCLDDAIASAITQYGSDRDATKSRKSARDSNDLSVLVTALSVCIESSQAAFQAIKEGKVGFAGSTGTVLERGLKNAETLKDCLEAAIAKSAHATP